MQTVDVIAVCQLGLMVAGRASSRASPLPQVGSGWSQILCLPHFSVGAELARDGGVSVDINVDCAAVIASRLTPTVWFWLVSDFVSAKHLVGAELARDGGLSVDINVD